jgi:hypothetical protein
MKEMKKLSRDKWAVFAVLVGAAFLLLITQALPACSSEGQKIFAAPEEAAKALQDACGANDEKALLEILGPESKPIIISSDKAGDMAARKNFHAKATERLTLEKSGASRMFLVIGMSSWPFPIPLVKDARGWRFDTAAGREEIINRRIGRDENNAIAVCRAYVDAQREYVAKDRCGNGILEYACKIASTPGKKDGLYWPAEGNQEISPFGPAIVSSSDYQAARKQGDPYYGYYFRILTKQGPAVPAGAFNYMINGHMLAGFALVAYPADYGTSGIMTFVVNQWGNVYQKDMGSDTPRIGAAMTEYNPDKSWVLVKDKGALATE